MEKENNRNEQQGRSGYKVQRSEREERLRIGISQGDGNPFQYEALARLFADSSIFDTALPFVYGSHYRLMAAGKAIGLNEMNPIVQNQIHEIKGKRLQVFLPQAESISEYTILDPFEMLQNAVTHLREGQLRALVSLPVSEEEVRQQHNQFKNQAMTVAQSFPGNPFRMLICRKIRMSFLTTVRREDSEKYLSSERIEQRIRDLYQTLKSDFSITTPRIAVLGMNKDLDSDRITLPGEQNIKPVVTALFESGMPVFGPYPAKSFLSGHDMDAFDAALCMYKEQMEMRLEKLPPEECCYYTAALPVIHVEPVFGGLDREGAFRSLLNSVYLAMDIDASRQMYRKLTENPLRYASVATLRKEGKEPKEEESPEKLLSQEDMPVSRKGVQSCHGCEVPFGTEK